jgi:hypothetical protein
MPQSVAEPVAPEVEGVCVGWVPYEVSPAVRTPFPSPPGPLADRNDDWRHEYYLRLEAARDRVSSRARTVLTKWPRCKVTEKRLALFVAKSGAADELSAWLICDHCNERRIKEKLWSRDRERIQRRERPINRNS